YSTFNDNQLIGGRFWGNLRGFNELFGRLDSLCGRWFVTEPQCQLKPNGSITTHRSADCAPRGRRRHHSHPDGSTFTGPNRSSSEHHSRATDATDSSGLSSQYNPHASGEPAPTDHRTSTTRFYTNSDPF